MTQSVAAPCCDRRAFPAPRMRGNYDHHVIGGVEMLDRISRGYRQRPSDVSRRSRITRLFELCYLSPLPPEQERDNRPPGGSSSFAMRVPKNMRVDNEACSARA